jgi:hypothetical protein
MDGYDGSRAHELATLRDALPGWGILYDPGRRLFIAVRGRTAPPVTAASPEGLLERITGQPRERPAPRTSMVRQVKRKPPASKSSGIRN